MGRGIGRNIGRGPINQVLTGLGLGDSLLGGSLVDGLTAPFDPAH